MPELLRLDRVTAAYGEAVILSDISFSLDEGQAMAVLGRNGMGKTTLIATLIGAARQHGGRLSFRGGDISDVPSHMRARRGIGWVPQEREVFPSLTVEENISVVSRAGSKWPLERIYELFPRLAQRRSNYGSKLSGGEQQMLAIARALATDPTVLLLDEPVEGLAPLVIQELIGAIRKMRSEGDLAILMVEQKFEIALANSDRCLVIDHGELVHACESSTLLADAALLDRLVGVGH